MKSAAKFFRVGNARKRVSRADSPHESDALTGADSVTHCMPIPTRFRKCCEAIYRYSDIYDATQNNWHMKHAMRVRRLLANRPGHNFFCAALPRRTGAPGEVDHRRTFLGSFDVEAFAALKS